MRRKVILTLALMIMIVALLNKSPETIAQGDIEDGCQGISEYCNDRAQEREFMCENHMESGSGYDSCYCKGQRAYEGCMQTSYLWANRSCRDNWRVAMVRMVSPECFSQQ